MRLLPRRQIKTGAQQIGDKAGAKSAGGFAHIGDDAADTIERVHGRQLGDRAHIGQAGRLEQRDFFGIARIERRGRGGRLTILAIDSSIRRRLRLGLGGLL